MTLTARTGSRAERCSSAMRRLGAASLLLAVALMAGACEGATQEARDATNGTPRATTGTSGDTGEPYGAGQTLSIVDVKSGTTTAFTAPLRASKFDVTLDGSMVTYTNGAQVFVMDADGSNARQLTHGLGGARGPNWSPDDSMIAYERTTSHGPQIFIVRVSNGVSTTVTREPRGAVDPAGWTPDGGSIVFSTINTEGNHYTARALDLATGESRLIVPDASTPRLSPDGAWIAFNSWLRPPGARLILANSDGSERRIIARANGDDAYQKWSPESTQIAFVASTDEHGFGTYVYDLATRKTHFVTAGTIECWIDDDHILVS